MGILFGEEYILLTYIHVHIIYNNPFLTGISVALILLGLEFELSHGLLDRDGLGNQNGTFSL